MNVNSLQPALATTAHDLTSPRQLLRQLGYEDLVEFAHEVGSALVSELDPRKKYKLRKMYLDAANEHSLRLTGRPLR